MSQTASLRFRLAAVALLWMAVFALLAGWALSQAFVAAARRALDEQLSAELLTLAAAIEVDETGRWNVQRPPTDPRFSRLYSGTYWQVVGPGQVERSRSLWDAELSLADAAEAGEAIGVDTLGPRGEPLRMLRQSLRLPRLESPLLIAVAEPRATLEAEASTFRRLLVLSLLGFALFFLGALWLQLGLALRPLRRLAASLRRLRGGEVSAIEEPQPAEIQPLADELNAVLAHNRRLIERSRAQAADLAHALKTPLALIDLEAQREGSAFGQRVREAVARIRRLSERHLARAGSAGAGGERAVAVACVVEALLGALRRIHAGRGIDWQIDVPTALAFRGEREDLEEMLGNLLDNAGKWALSRVRVEADAQDVRVQLRVHDDGPGLDADQRQTAMLRGRRFDEQVEGSGLGLAIVADIAEAHGGALRLLASPLGGLCAELELPRYQAAA